MQGDADEIVDANAVAAWVDKMPDPPELVRMPEAGHFFHRRLIDLRGWQPGADAVLDGAAQGRNG